MAFREIEPSIRVGSASLLVSIYNAELLSEEDESELFQLLFIDDFKIGKIVGEVCSKMLVENHEKEIVASEYEKIFADAKLIIDGLKKVFLKDQEANKIDDEEQDDLTEETLEIHRNLLVYIDTLGDSIEKTYDFMGAHIVDHVCSIIAPYSDELVIIQ